MHKAHKILVIDDHQLFADGLQLLLAQLPGAANISTFGDAQAVLEQPSLWQDADLIIIDLHIPHFSGFSFLQALQTVVNAPPIVVISGVENRSEIERALALGARGFIPKESGAQEMLNGVSQALQGQRYLPARWIGKIDWPTSAGDAQPGSATISPSTNIGPRQQQVLRLLQDGLQNKQIALVLGVSVSTVKSHTQMLYRTLNVTNRTAAIKAATELGLL